MSPDTPYPRSKLLITRHALAVMLLGLIAGFAYAFALLGEVKLSPIPLVFADSFPGEAARWRAAHVGCLMNGIMALAFAAVFGLFDLSETQSRRVTIAVVMTVWGNGIFYIGSVFSPNRALSVEPNVFGAATVVGVIGYLAALLAAFALLYVVVALLLSRARPA